MLQMPRIIRPDPRALSARNLVSPLDRPLAGAIKRNKEPPKHLIESNYSQGRRPARNSLPLNERPMEILGQ